MKNNFKLHVALFLLASLFMTQTFAQQTLIEYLSGTDKDHTVNWEFMVNNGRKADTWSTIPVPSCWEMQGFGTYSYYQDIKEASERGMYKHNFAVSPQQKGKKIFLVFDGSMTDTEVKINGQSAGPAHMGGFYQFKYDITSLVKFSAANLLEATVSKKSANNSINRAERQADFWLFGGIYRPVYLEIVPATFIERVAIDAKADGAFRMQVFNNAGSNHTIEAQVFDLFGKAMDKPFKLASGDTMLRHWFTNIQPWNPEQPNLYNVVVSIKEGTTTVHTVRQRLVFARRN
jgi:beta-galactosidase/beta-glucuronidase